MNRYGYMLVAALLIALLVYVLWPEPSDHYEPIWQGEIPARYTLEVGDLVQEVRDGQVYLMGLQRSLDESAQDRLWHLFANARSNRWRDDVAVDDLSAFGIGDRRLSADNVDLRWGHRDEHTYIYDGASNRLHIMRRTTYDSIERTLGRLDQRAILHRVEPVHTLHIDDLSLQWNAAQERWRDQDAAQRPPFGPRVEDLLMALRRLRVDTLDAETTPLQVLHSIRIGFADNQEQLVEIASDEQNQWWLRGDAVPPQRLSAHNRAALTERIEAFALDPLLHIPLESADPTIRRAEVWRDGSWWFALESSEDAAGERVYEILWQEGRDPAAVRALWNFQQALNELTVSDVQPRAEVATAEAQLGEALHIRVWGRQDRLLADLRLGNDRALTENYVGTVAELPTWLQDLAPDAFLDRNLLPPGLDPQRVTKFQRVRYEPNSGTPQAEVFGRGDSGWRSLHPAERGVDHQAVQRVIQGIISAEGERAWLPADTIPEHPQASIALRIAGAAEGDGRSELAMEDTFDRDWGLRLFSREDGDWDAYEVERGMRYLLPGDLVQEWFANLTQVPVLPVLAHQVLHLRWEDGDDAYTLRRTSDDRWRLLADGDEQAADEREVRRLLRDLVALTAQDLRPQAAILSRDETRARLLIGIPGADPGAHEQWIMSIGSVDDQRTQLSVHREGTRMSAQGRMWVDTAALSTVMAPAQRFRPLDHDGNSHEQ